MVKCRERLDLVVKGLDYDVLSLARIKKEFSSLRDPSDIIYVGNELWKNIVERGLECAPEIISFLRNVIYRANERMRDLSMRDYLTGLFNRRFLDSELKKQLALTYRNPHNPFSVIMFDIDRFKVFNDIYGHNAGDVVLKALSGIVLGSIRDSDVAFRYGGEEFIILLQNTNQAGALDIAYRLNHQVANTKVTFVDEKGKEHRKPITVSTGVVEINRENPIWLLHGTKGKRLIVNYVNKDSNLDEMLDDYTRRYVDHSSVQGDKVTRENVKKNVKRIGDFVKSYIVEENSNVHIPITQCAEKWIIKEVDDLAYYAKERGRNCVAYMNGDGVKIVEKSK